MVDFAEGISDRAAGRRLSASLQGKGAFRRFKNEVYEHHPELISAWQALRDARAEHRAVQWLVDEGLVDEGPPNGSRATTRSPTCREAEHAPLSAGHGCCQTTARHTRAIRPS